MVKVRVRSGATELVATMSNHDRDARKVWFTTDGGTTQVAEEHCVDRVKEPEELEVGDRVRLTLPNGWWAEGHIKTAQFWSQLDGGWYVELIKDRVAYMPIGKLGVYGYGYWKQGQDGGTIEKIDPLPDGWRSEKQPYRDEIGREKDLFVCHECKTERAEAYLIKTDDLGWAAYCPPCAEPIVWPPKIDPQVALDELKFDKAMNEIDALASDKFHTLNLWDGANYHHAQRKVTFYGKADDVRSIFQQMGMDYEDFDIVEDVHAPTYPKTCFDEKCYACLARRVK